MNLDDYTEKIKEIYFEEIKATSRKQNAPFDLHAYGSEGTIPHIHYSNDRVCGCVKFTEPKYFCHEKKHDGLTSHERRDLNILLHNKDIWQRLVNEWNKSSLQVFKLPEDIQPPDYIQLPNLNPSTGKLNKEDRK